MIPEKFKSYFTGKNNLFYPEYEFIIKLSYPKVFVKYKVAEGYYTDFDKFFKNIAEVQYIDGERPSEYDQQRILDEIWNYITMDKGSHHEDYISDD